MSDFARSLAERNSDPAERRWYQVGNEFGGWLIQNHCGYRPTIAQTWFGPWFAWDPPAPHPWWDLVWADSRTPLDQL